MPSYVIACYEECGVSHETEVPYYNLDRDQLESINAGQPFMVYEWNKSAFGYKNGGDGKPANDQGQEDTTDYRKVCPDCGSDQ